MKRASAYNEPLKWMKLPALEKINIRPVVKVDFDLVSYTFSLSVASVEKVQRPLVAS